MSKYLRQKWSGHIYVWSESLAARDDMEPCEPPAPPAPEPVPAPAVEPETPDQNLAQRPPLPPLDEAVEAFKRESGKPRRKKDQA